jgi:DNA-binding response OmpR family regulator
MPRIMVIDDDANIRAVLKYRLEQEGFIVRLAANGIDALEEVDAQKPDLIILDLMMPEMDGMQFLSTLRSNPQTNSIPVIILTALGRTLQSERTLALGAADLVTKPFSPRDLVELVREAPYGAHAGIERRSERRFPVR